MHKFTQIIHYILNIFSKKKLPKKDINFLVDSMPKQEKKMPVSNNIGFFRKMYIKTILKKDINFLNDIFKA